MALDGGYVAVSDLYVRKWSIYYHGEVVGESCARKKGGLVLVCVSIGGFGVNGVLY